VSKRFPFASLPRGWFVVGFSSDVAPGAVKTVHYFGQDIVLFRTEGGVLAALDKTCPHLGAHLGGGHVEGNCLRCPFHAWAFDTAGSCVDVPYAPKIPHKAATRTWAIREQNGVIFVWYCPRGEPPTWEIPAAPEEGWMPNRVIRWEIRSHPQEIAENTVDIAHLRPVHHTISAEVMSIEQTEHVMRVVLRMVATGAPIDMPDEINEVELDVSVHGLGRLISSTTVLTAGLQTRQLIYPTPIDDERVAIFGVTNIKKMPDPDYTRELDDIFYSAFVTDFAKDFPIWENKTYLDKPMLAGGDGPIGRYRKWARQFYDAPEAAPQPAAAPPQQSLRDRLAPLLNSGRLTPLLGRFSKLLSTVAPFAAPAPATPPPAGEAPSDEPPAAGKPRPRPIAATPPPRIASVDAYFNSLEGRFNPDAAGDLDAVFQWVLTGAEPRSHFVEIKAGSAQASPGTHPTPTVAIEMSAEDYLLLINGELNGPLAFSTGRGRLRGPVRLAMKMQKLFPLDRAV